MNFRDTLNWLPKRRKRFARTGFRESTLAELAWQHARHAASRWGTWGVVAGVLFGIVAFAPAGWLARGIASASGGRVLMTDARGTLWAGSSVLVLTGGPGSRDASALPGRLSWNVGVKGLGFELRLKQACCINGEAVFQVKPGLGRVQVTLLPPPPGSDGAVAQWPAAWLEGLGTPWNTLQLGGVLKLTSPGFSLESAEGRWHMSGQADLLLLGISSRVSTLDSLGSYRLSLVGGPGASATTQIRLSTVEGALQLTGAGQWTAGKVRFRGDARASAGSEAALNNLLNIIGRRQGALSLISIG